MHIGRLSNFNLISPIAGEVWYAASLLDALMLQGLAVFFFVFSALPYWHKLRYVLSRLKERGFADESVRLL